jgi:copper chaperone CopZ
VVVAWLKYYLQPVTLKLAEYAETRMEITLNVEGMRWRHGVASVKKSFQTVDGAEQAIPDLDSGKVVINGSNMDNATLKTVIDAAAA